jgi:hypothetical protein
MLTISAVASEEVKADQVKESKPFATSRTIQTTSTVRYDAAPDRPHRLVMTCASSDRTRWQLERGEGPSQQRQIRFRSGEHLYTLEPGTATSVELAGAEAAEALRHIELRRALIAWPDGFAWKGSGLEREADQGTAGKLRARFARTEDRNPFEIADIDPEGRARDAYRRIEWREIEGRTWPASAELWHGDERVWSETIETATTRSRFLDSFFLPPDRVAPGAAESAEPQLVAVPAVCSRRFALSGGPEPTPAVEALWEKARAEIESLHAEWAPRLRAGGLELEAKATVEVDDQIRPKACILRLTHVPETPPEGFTTAAARKAAVIASRGVDQLTRAHLQRVTTALPADCTRGEPYVRFELTRSAAGQALLVLPCAAAKQ